MLEQLNPVEFVRVLALVPEPVIITQVDLAHMKQVNTWFEGVYTGQIYRAHLFCALVYKIYQPDLLSAEVRINPGRSNLNTALGFTLKCSKPYISQVYKDILFYSRAYADFREIVADLHSQYLKQWMKSKL